MNNNELNYKEAWDGQYRNVKYEVIHWRLGWNYYLYIPIEQLPEEYKNKFNLRGRASTFGSDKEPLFYDYSGASIISDLDWHIGITLYEKKRNERGKVVGYRLGCDYMHLWDEDKYYNIDIVTGDAKHSIDKLWELIPNLKLRCSWNGKYYDEDEIYYTDKGVCVALENKEKWNKPV